MQNFMELVTSRRSIRRFQDRPVAEETMQAVLEAARWTPSWANSQCWEIIAVQDRELLGALAESLSPKNPATLAVAKGPVTLVICGRTQTAGWYKGVQSTKFEDWMMFDLGLLTQTISLAAHAEGLGSVVVGAFEHDKVQDLVKLPPGYEVVALLPMGYPDHAPSPPKRREVAEFTHRENFETR